MHRWLDVKRGIDVPDHKSLTAHKPIRSGPVPDVLIFPMAMHIGAPAIPAVKPGDAVSIGTLIGKEEEDVSANVHSSVSGAVTAVEERPSFRGTTTCVVVENDGTDKRETLPPLDMNVSLDSFVQRIFQAGITGKGGAGFPTHVKMAPSEQGHHTLLINGAECEPYATTDHRVMLEHTHQLLTCISLMTKLFQVERTLIAIEENKKDAIQCFRERVSEMGDERIRVVTVETRYPQGHQGVLLKNLTDLEVSQGTSAAQVGIISTNISTIKAIHDAVLEGKPLTERVVTVTGPVIRNPQNLMVRTGTPVEDLVNACGGFSGEVGKMIHGGPMMGTPFSDTSIPVVKDTTTLLFLPPDPEEDRPEAPCIRCARCVNACPVSLQPILIHNAHRAGRLDLSSNLQAETCIQCGCCTYVCPSKIPLLASIRKERQALRAEGGRS